MRRLDRLRQVRICAVVAPAGEGKTTALANWSRTAPVDVAWLRAPAGALDPVAAVLAGIGDALDAVAPGRHSAPTPAALAERLRAHQGPLVVVIDDFHHVAVEAVGDVLEELLLRTDMHLVVACGPPPRSTWRAPSCRACGSVPTDLRFRPAETEELFRTVYEAPLTEADARLLTRQVGGWAAGLHLFHHATAPAGPAARRRALRDPSAAGRVRRGVRRGPGARRPGPGRSRPAPPYVVPRVADRASVRPAARHRDVRAPAARSRPAGRAAPRGQRVPARRAGPRPPRHVAARRARRWSRPRPAAAPAPTCWKPTAAGRRGAHPRGPRRLDRRGGGAGAPPRRGAGRCRPGLGRRRTRAGPQPLAAAGSGRPCCSARAGWLPPLDGGRATRRRRRGVGPARRPRALGAAVDGRRRAARPLLVRADEVGLPAPGPGPATSPRRTRERARRSTGRWSWRWPAT